MKEYIWILCEELDPTECWDETNTKNIQVFTDFESAKKALWKLMRARACTENNVFDGKGGIRGLTERIQEVLDWDEGDEREENGRAILKGLHDLFIEGKPFPAEYHEGIYEFYCELECSYDIDAYGEYYFSVNGECGGVDTRIYINTFQMDDPEKTYVCRLDCKFDEEDEENNGFWAVTLKHTALNQFP